MDSLSLPLIYAKPVLPSTHKGADYHQHQQLPLALSAPHAKINVGCCPGWQPLAAAVLAHKCWQKSRGRVLHTAAVLRASVQASLPYQADHIERGLKYTGVGAVDDIFKNAETSMKSVTITDGRSGNWTLDDHGFTRVEDTPELLDFYNEMAICKNYYPQCENLVKKVTGAAKVHAFYHTVRSHESVPGAARRQQKGFPVEAPAAAVHVDYSEACAATLMRQFAKPPHEWQDPRPLLGFQPLMNMTEIDQYLKGKQRWAIINVWRNLSSEPVQRTPVALCAGTSASKDDIVTFRVQKQWETKEYYFAVHSDSHEWYYFPHMKRDEAILIKNWDSVGEAFARDTCTNTVPCTFAFHTAFDDPNTQQGAPVRETMEVRTVAFW
eukprot:TRINITY_DN42330_c0_g1_i1.p1 TRINITY_DN42330_c0_g1~~TRINITY_DN42330_c0_g1_i1.p1  ORF type:complete len:392 (+),score=34.99 TRINITY_DN42330_c0_g1_i1:34-1176(+)